MKAEEISDEIVAVALAAFNKAINDPIMEKCERCSGKGYHHGFGENGHDPDWCEVCGGGAWNVRPGEEDRAMRAALSAALQSERENWERAERNRDMYKGQSERQAVALETVRIRTAALETVIALLVDAISPLANAVFNDNGDISLTPPHPTAEQCVDAYFASSRASELAAARKALGEAQ